MSVWAEDRQIQSLASHQGKGNRRRVLRQAIRWFLMVFSVLIISEHCIETNLCVFCPANRCTHHKQTPTVKSVWTNISTHGRRKWGHWSVPLETAGSPSPESTVSALQPQSWYRGCSPRRSVVFGWGLSWRQTFWGNKWFSSNDIFVKKVVTK